MSRRPYTTSELCALAARANAWDYVMHLLEQGADPNITNVPGAWEGRVKGLDKSLVWDRNHDSTDRNTLHVAVRHGAPEEVLRGLIAAGARIQDKDSGGYAPLHDACDIKQSDVAIRLLLEAGADPNVKDGTEWTPILTLLNAHPSLEGVRLLLQAGADPNAVTSSDKTTALHFAIHANDPAIVAALLEHGADPLLQDVHGETALQLAHKLAEKDDLFRNKHRVLCEMIEAHLTKKRAALLADTPHAETSRRGPTL